MAWTHCPTLVGKLYIPDFQEAHKKHPCPDCFGCQHCGDARCDICLAERRQKAAARKGSSPEDDGKPSAPK